MELAIDGTHPHCERKSLAAKKIEILAPSNGYCRWTKQIGAREPEPCLPNMSVASFFQWLLFGFRQMLPLVRDGTYALSLREALMSLIAIAILNGLLGASSGLWFRVQILIPLIVIAFVDIAIIAQTEMSPSVVWWVIVLISSLEIGYLIGSAVPSFWQSSRSRKSFHDVTPYGHGKLSE